MLTSLVVFRIFFTGVATRRDEGNQQAKECINDSLINFVYCSESRVKLFSVPYLEALLSCSDVTATFIDCSWLPWQHHNFLLHAHALNC